MAPISTKPLRILHWDAFRKSYAEQAFASQMIPCINGNLTICCHFILFSPGNFTQPMAFRHLCPLFSRIFFTQNGTVRLTMGEKHYWLEPGKFHLIPAGHSFDIDYPAGLYCIACHANFTDGAGFSLTQNFTKPLVLKNDALYQAVLQTPLDNISLLLALYMAVALEFFAPYFEDFAKRSNGAIGIYKAILNHLEVTPPGQVRLEQLAKTFHVSRAMLSKGFYRQFGVSFKQHLQEMLLNQAKQLLIETNLTPKEIAARIGMCEVSNFYRFFRSRTGVTPVVYRLHNRDMQLHPIVSKSQ